MTQAENSPIRFIGLDVHKHYLICIGVDEDLNQVLGPQRVELSRLEKWMVKTLHKTDVVVLEMTTNTWQLHRDQMAPKRERSHHINRIKGLLASQGVKMAIKTDFLTQLEMVPLWDGSRLGCGFRDRLERAYQRYQLVQAQIRQIDQIRREAIRSIDTPALAQVRQLLRLKGIGLNSAWVYGMAFFAWRNFRNRRELGALAGLPPTPYQSGDGGHQQSGQSSRPRHGD